MVLEDVGRSDGAERLRLLQQSYASLGSTNKCQLVWLVDQLLSAARRNIEGPVRKKQRIR